MGSVRIEGGWLVRLDVGAKLPDALAEFCRQQGLPSATAEGLGALRDVELGFAGARADALRRFAALQRALGDLPGDPWPPRAPSSASSISSGSGGTP